MIKKQKMTLMEMIMVMLIIIILLTILLPIGMKGREWGKSIACKGNIKSVGTAYLGYAADWDGIAPQGTGAMTGAWLYPLVKFEYLPDEKVNQWNTYNLAWGMVNKHIPFSRVASNASYNAYPYYQSVYTCPSLPVGENIMRNEWLRGQCEQPLNSKSTAFQWNNGSHYVSNNQLPWYSYWKQKVTNPFGGNPFGLGFRAQCAMIVGDGPGGSTVLYYNGLNPMKQMYWGRHFGQPVNVTYSNISGTSWVYYGSGKMNMMMLDGHMESRNCIEVQKSPRAW